MKKRQTNIKKEVLVKLVNPSKLKILDVIQREGKINQWDISIKSGVSYRETRRHIDALHKAGIIQKQKMKKTIGNPVFISLKKKR